MNLLSKNFKKISEFKNFIGPEVWSLFLFSLFIGLFWFVIDSSFVFVLQGFLRAIGLLETSKAYLPDFYPTSSVGSVLMLFLFGILRSSIVLVKRYYAKVIRQTFMRVQKEKILEYALTKTENVNSHEIINLFGERVSQAGTVVVSIASIFHLLVSAILLFVFGLKLAPYEMTLGVALLGVFLFPFKFINKKIKLIGEAYVEESRILFRVMLVSLKNFFLLRLYNHTQKEIDKGKNAAKRFEELFNKFTLLSSFKAAFPQLAGTIIISTLCLVSLTYLNTPGAKLLSFFYLFMRLSQALGEASAQYAQLKFNLESYDMLTGWYNGLLDYHDFNKDILNDEKQEDINFDDGVSFKVEKLKFSYDGDEELFKGLSFELNKGDVLLVKGRSGSGKSTLLTLLLGMRDVTDGSIEINGIKAVNAKKALANNVGYVGPEPYLIAGTVADNLRYGHNDPDNVSEEQMWSALKEAQLDNVIKGFDDGLHKNLREVAELSTGQKQRLSIARALLRKPKLLVLDEATANLDGETEDKFVEVLKNIKSDITLLIISHKNSFDRISNIEIDLENKDLIEGKSIEGSLYA